MDEIEVPPPLQPQYEIPGRIDKAPEIKDRQTSLFQEAMEASELAKLWLLKNQKQDGHWCAELESNTTITSEYVFLYQILGLDLSQRRDKLVGYLFQNQKADGSWGIAWNYQGDISSTAETYLALRILGVGEDDPRMKSAGEFIRNNGGIEKVRIFTRINFALFGLFPWASIPIIPPEFILFPPQCPVNIYKLSSWARGTMVPLFIIFHHKPVFELPNGRSKNNDWLDHLWLDPKHKKVAYMDPVLEIIKKNGMSWRSLFSASDLFLHAYERLESKKKLREYAVKKCEQWILERQERSGDWAGIFPPMVNGVLALYLNGYSLDSDPIRRGLEAIERFTIDDKEGFRVQACVSPIWDTVLSMIAMVDSGPMVKPSKALMTSPLPKWPAQDEKLSTARKWLVKRQLLVDYGDWKIYNPNGPSGGWSFEYENSWYPDVDDTGAIIIGLLKQDPSSRNSFEVRRAVEWVVSMQNKDGGWAAFDVNNDKLYLNQIPFSDMDSLCDPSSPDVTGRVLEGLGLLDDPKYRKVCDKGVQYLRRSQEPEGSWFGRWGVNYIYGTSNALCGLRGVRMPAEDRMIQRALTWLKSVQNPDGGWGECLESYSDRTLMGKGKSTASQTAWALMGLLAYLPPTEQAIEQGILWLIRNQKKKGKASATWEEPEFTGTGFPNHFYIRYHLYRHYFPLMALGRFCSAQMD